MHIAVSVLCDLEVLKGVFEVSVFQVDGAQVGGDVRLRGFQSE